MAANTKVATLEDIPTDYVRLSILFPSTFQNRFSGVVFVNKGEPVVTLYFVDGANEMPTGFTYKTLGQDEEVTLDQMETPLTFVKASVTENSIIEFIGTPEA